MKGKKLYEWLSDPVNLKYFSWEKQDQGDGMSVVVIAIDGWLKPIYLVDDRNKSAVQFMGMDQHLLTVSEKDIDWSTVTEKLDGFIRARSLNAVFPTNFRGFENNVGLLQWEINPSGRYYMDEDGFGMTPDQEVALYGFIGRDGSVVEPFRYIGNDRNQLAQMRARAEKKYQESHKRNWLRGFISFS